MTEDKKLLGQEVGRPAPMRLKTFSNVLGAENVHAIEKTLGAEDFGEFMKHAPGAMFTLGTQKQGHENYLLHHPKFDLDERALSAVACRVKDAEQVVLLAKHAEIIPAQAEVDGEPGGGPVGVLPIKPVVVLEGVPPRKAAGGVAAKSRRAGQEVGEAAEAVLRELGGEKIERLFSGGAEIVTADLQAQRVKVLLERLKSFSEEKEKDRAAEASGGIVALRIEIRPR